MRTISWRITRPVGRVRIETRKMVSIHEAAEASPGRLAGCGLKLLMLAMNSRPCTHHPAGWPGAD